MYHLKLRMLTLFQRLSPNVWVAATASFLTDLSSEMVFHLLPLFLANVIGAPTSVIGLIEGLAETTASLLKIYSGWISDRIGKRKRLMVLGYGISTIAKPFLFFATSWWGVLSIRVADRVGKGIRNAPRDALIADSVDPKSRGLAFGIHRAGDTAGALTSFLLAIAIVWATQTNSLTLTHSTFQWIAILSVIPASLAVLVLIVGARDIVRNEEIAPPKLKLSLKNFESRFRRFLPVLVVFTLGNSADAFLILRAQEQGLNVIGILGMLVTFTFVYAVVSVPAGSLSDRIGRRKIIIAGWLTYGLIYLGFALATEVWHIWGLYTLYGLYFAMTDGVTRAFVADIVPAHQRGSAYGLYNAAVGAAAFPASLIAGVLWQGVGTWQGFGPQSPFIFGAILALLAAGLFVFWVPSSPDTTN